VVSVAAKGGARPRQVRSGETSASEPLMTCRNRIDGVETGEEWSPRDQCGRSLATGPRGTRLEGGVNPDQALVRNVGTCRLDAKGAVQVGEPHENQSTNARHRDGAARSRVEGFETELDRRGCDVQSHAAANR
jgi:hypothetical protein